VVRQLLEAEITRQLLKSKKPMFLPLLELSRPLKDYRALAK
jgi:hypothetical protein